MDEEYEKHLKLALSAESAEWKTAHALTAIAFLFEQCSFVNGNY